MCVHSDYRSPIARRAHRGESPGSPHWLCLRQSQEGCGPCEGGLWRAVGALRFSRHQSPPARRPRITAKSARVARSYGLPVSTTSRARSASSTSSRPSTPDVDFIIPHLGSSRTILARRSPDRQSSRAAQCLHGHIGRAPVRTCSKARPPSGAKKSCSERRPGFTRASAREDHALHLPPADERLLLGQHSSLDGPRLKNPRGRPTLGTQASVDAIQRPACKSADAIGGSCRSPWGADRAAWASGFCT